MEIVKVNDYLSFVIEPKKGGDKITCIYDGQSIGYKGPCQHTECIVLFIAEFTLMAKQMRDMESIFQPDYNPN